METRLWTDRELLELASFNWATDFSPWKPNYTMMCIGTTDVLQLGHGFFSVETCAIKLSKRSRHTLLQLGHGFFSVETGPVAALTGNNMNRFNWATDFSPWKPAYRDKDEL